MSGLAYTEDEVVLCTYAALYDSGDFGGIDAVFSLRGRSWSSIDLKFGNIAAMLDEKGIVRESKVRSLPGVPKGKSGRETHWPLVSKLVRLSRAELLAECQKILERHASLPGELHAEDRFVEGTSRQVLVNRYERDPAARRACIERYGSTCVVCGFDFAKQYGPFAVGFIHVHHLKPLSEIGAAYRVDPLNDLRPVCPNCHAAIHLGGVTRTIDEVKRLVDASRQRRGSAASL